MSIESLCQTHVRCTGPNDISGCRALPARWPVRARPVTTPAAEHGAYVLRAKGKADGGKVESSGASDTLTGVPEWENARK
jgi:hypothetical protein